MNKELYAKVRDQARTCRDAALRKKLQLFLEVIRSGQVLRSSRIFGYSSTSYYYYWWKRFRDSGFQMVSLREKSRRPKRSPRQISIKIVRKIRKYRIEFRYGPKRIAYYLWHNHRIKVSESTVRRTIERRGWVLRKNRTKKKNPHRKRYELPIPGHLQVDIKYVPKRKIGQRWYVYNAIDDCSRWRYAKAYRAINAKNSVDFVKGLIQVAPFRILSIQTDNDVVFTNRLSPFWLGLSEHPFTAALKGLGIQHRLIPPGFKELNGKVERSHRIDDEEFYWKVQLECFPAFQTELIRWIYAYNHHRPHGGIDGESPIHRLLQKLFVWHYALAIHYGALEFIEGETRVKQSILGTYLIYLDWIQADPFHSLDVMNYYILKMRENGPLRGIKKEK